MTLTQILESVEETIDENQEVIGCEIEFMDDLENSDNLLESLTMLSESAQEEMGKKAIDLLWDTITSHNKTVATRMDKNPDATVARKKLAKVRFITKGSLKKATKSTPEHRVGGNIPKSAIVYGVGSADIAQFKGDVGAAQAALTKEKDGCVSFKADLAGHEWKTMCKDLVTNVRIIGGKEVKVKDGDIGNLLQHVKGEAMVRIKAAKLTIPVLKAFKIDEKYFPEIKSKKAMMKYVKNKNLATHGKGVTAKKNAAEADTIRKDKGEEKAAASFYSLKSASTGDGMDSDGIVTMKLEISMTALLKSPVVVEKFGEDADLKSAKQFIADTIHEVNPSFAIATKYATLQVK